MLRMNGMIGFLLLVSLTFLTSCSTLNTDPTTDKQLLELVASKNFFKLRTALETAKDKLSEDRWLYYQAFCNNAFDKCEESNKNIETLLSKHSNSLNDTIKEDILRLRAGNNVRLYKYKDAADTYSKILNEYSHILDSSDIDNYSNVLQLWSTVANVKPQLIHKHGDVEIKGYRNQFNILMVPVKIGDVCEDFVFDTGANLSTVTQSYAEKMNMTIYKSNINVGTATHIEVQTMLAAADSIYVGDLLFENVVFLVVPDENLSFPSRNLYIRGIIGFPVIHQMEELHLRKNGSLYIPSESKDKQLANMYLNNLEPIVLVSSNADTLIFCLDTGAVNTELSKRYYDKHKEEVETNGVLVKRSRGGGGGIIEVDEYKIKSFPFTIGSKSDTLDKISINIEEFDFLKNFDGNLGQDIISKYDEMVLNFKYMYLDFN